MPLQQFIYSFTALVFTWYRTLKQILTYFSILLIDG